MATIHYITPYPPDSWENPDEAGETSDLRIFFSDFIAKLKEEFQVVVSPPFSWVLGIGDEFEVSGSLIGEDMQILGLELGTKFADFVIWYRSYIPDRYGLYLFREGEWTSLKITSETSIEEVEKYVFS